MILTKVSQDKDNKSSNIKTMPSMKNLIYLTLGLGNLNSIKAEEVQLRSDELGRCLTFSQTDTMGAYNPETSEFGNYPLAKWEPCIEFDTSQLFEYTSQNQLVANGLCLTPLPITDTFHPNLDSCDTWNFLPGAGTYLFAIECQNIDNNNINNHYQSFSYDSTSQTLTSNCNHGFFLGSVGNTENDYKSFLTDSENTFPSAEILTGFNLPVTDIITVTQNKIDAAIEILSEFLSNEDATAVSNHGCWCSKITGFNPDFVGEAVDDIDKLCKEWSLQRRCNSLISGGSCPSNLPITPQYTIQKSSGAGTSFSCDTADNLIDDCSRDSCLIDATYASAIYDTILADPTWSSQVQTSGECSRITFNPGNGGANGGLVSGNNGQMCSGEAPNLTIERL